MTTDLGVPTPDDVRRIAALADPVLRNYQITQAYHETAVAVARLLPGGANWCTVATWASRQAGQSIRREDLRRTLERLLRESRDALDAAETLQAESAIVRQDATESLAGAVAALRDAISPAAAFDRTADAVARGNRKVFEEIGLEFARFLTLFDGDTPDAATFGAFRDSLRPGDPPDGQRYLRDAFTHYYRAMLEPAAKARAELMLLANLEIGFHEQARLQPEIRAAMDAPVYNPRDLRRRLMDELFPDPGSRLRLAVARLAGRAGPLLAARDQLADEAQRLGRLAITELLMTLELPGPRVLRLGHELGARFPDALTTLANPDLLALYLQLEPPEGRGRDAMDWGELPDRLRFIADLFRAGHDDAQLFNPPFSAAQTAAIKDGRLPDNP